MSVLESLARTLAGTVWDVLPIIVVVSVFQLLVIRRPIPNLRRVVLGFVYVLLGLALFLEGLDRALFPFGRLMAEQLTPDGGASHWWWDYQWVYLFAVAIGFSTTIAEPSLIAVALKANHVSGGAISTWGLRIAVAIGVALGIGLGAYRIVSGTPLYWYIIAAYVVVILQTLNAPRMIVPLAYDSGGVTTSTVTVPLVAALGLGLASAVPGRSPVLDGFGLIAFASVFPIVTVLGYAQIVAWLARRANHGRTSTEG